MVPLAVRIAQFRFNLGMPFRKCIGDVFEKNKAKNDVLVFPGIHIITEFIRHLPAFCFKTKICAIEADEDFFAMGDQLNNDEIYITGISSLKGINASCFIERDSPRMVSNCSVPEFLS